MKTRSIVLGLMVVCAGTAMAQENDDMYFNSKDRAKLEAKKAKEATVLAYTNEAESTESAVETDELTPTESYSTRNTNPEYTSRSNSEVAQSDNEDYFVSNYSYNNAQNLNRFNNNYNNWYNNPWYSNAYYVPSMYANSAYYGGFYNPWNSGYGSGWYGSLGYSWGSSPYYGGYYGSGYNAWDYGYGGYYGYGNPYGSYYGNSWGYYGGGWNNYNYWGNNVIIINDGTGRNVAYGKRPTRGGMMNSESAGNRTRSQIVSRGDGNSGGRVATSNSGRTQQTAGRQDEYYNRSWRRTTEAPASTRTTRPAWDNSTPTRTISPGNSRSTDWNNGGSRSYEPSRSSSGSSGGSRSGGSSSGSSSSGGSGGRTRSH